MKSTLRVSPIGIVLIAAASSELARGDYDHCNTYYNSRIVSNMQWGTYCGDIGPGCEYCWDDEGGAYCYGNLPDGCGIDHQVLPW